MFFLGVGLGRQSWASPLALLWMVQQLLHGCSTRILFSRTVLWLLWASALCLPVQSRQSKYNRAWILVEAGVVSWMGNHLGLLKFHQKDLIPGSGTVLGRGLKLYKPCVSLSHSAEQDRDTCLPTGRPLRTLAESHPAELGCETAHVLICEVGCLALSQMCT